MENKPKFLMCAKYDIKIVLKNRQLGAFEEHTSQCSGCDAKVLISRASLDLLASDKNLNLICQDCAAKLLAADFKPEFSITAGHLEEMKSALVKINAANN